MATNLTIIRFRRHKRLRAKITGTAARPRLAVFRSLRHISAQLINDIENKTIAAASEAEIKNVGKLKRQQIAQEVGKLIAEKAKALTVKSVVFDRGGNAYHGRVKALAEGAREAGLEF
ncbi:MAG: 50S ribosomal protein L18 [Parcubacteria group bacterium GW2011_GWD2_43_10]|uniref:Large ribosomal subunit protein uL18 n=4 Tax=Candidatus Vebleniibacteriota TaxID=1817921 RepID=A0A1G2QAQ1_9BACT|nr:MAG: 50S ribosomal protein L18 [Parcubacteria group bacterium GW2011_GWA2_42_80]KKS78569.1 MAG: 50S ribosomal protein L18 [Parcubacteria group bacterium GW2011_GWD1_42_9]KKS83205.1 MAG: 50S ribosomal protein L18 [Parcubacteria group bacterium GW2011_GWD2_43_10]KKS92890.1 MAG: 50S ribosomal protein L18 [Parcubacteria group bacterium GW2011_GWE2_43_12]KKT13427.1 MAG: 50S ribosomal protein L18 [Parcubacteria group bacterium GW2011_GWA1_43_27]KKT14972.1 MAG: 50S ribosomal protein L18 [Parcubact